MACLTFSRHREGIAKRHYQNMIRRHATWDLPTVRNLRISLWFYFGEVFSIAKIRCCVRCWGPFGLAQLLGGSGGRGATALPVVRGSALLPWVIRPARRADPTSWSRQARPLPWFRESRTRRCQRSNSASPLRGKTEIVCHIPPPNASGILEN